jgi:hypothetical protein
MNESLATTIALNMIQHRIHRMPVLDIGKVEDGHHTTCCNDNYLLSMACKNSSTIPTLVREPTHPPPRTIQIAAAAYPAISLELKGDAAFMLVYLNFC